MRSSRLEVAQPDGGRADEREERQSGLPLGQAGHQLLDEHGRSHASRAQDAAAAAHDERHEHVNDLDAGLEQRRPCAGRARRRLARTAEHPHRLRERGARRRRVGRPASSTFRPAASVRVGRHRHAPHDASRPPAAP